MPTLPVLPHGRPQNDAAVPRPNSSSQAPASGAPSAPVDGLELAPQHPPTPKSTAAPQGLQPPWAEEFMAHGMNRSERNVIVHALTETAESQRASLIAAGRLLMKPSMTGCDPAYFIRALGRLPES